MSRATTAALCVMLLALFATLAYLAASSKSPTYDEPLHALSAHVQVHGGDFRVDPEDPPLWKYWAAIPNRRGVIKVPTDTPAYAAITDDVYHEWQYTVETLYRTDDNAARSDDFVQRSRAMMVVLGVALGGLIAWWGWQLGGPIAAITATALFALCPNFLAHTALVKNDVPLALCATGLIFAVWRAGRRLTILNALAVGLLCAAVITVKFSGLLFGPIVALLLILRALSPQPWETFWRTLEWRTDKLVAALLLIVLAGFISYGGIWASYGFHFGPAHGDPSVRFNMKQMVVYASMAEHQARFGHLPTTQETEKLAWSVVSKTLMTMEDMHFLPQPWLYGLFYTYQSALVRKTFLLGKFSNTGWWYYFPLAMLTKTPLATLLAAVGGIAMLVMAIAQRGWKSFMTWTAACLFIPPAVFLASAMRSNLNLGLRHVLPIYPFIFLGTGLAMAEGWRRWRMIAKVAAAVLAIGLTTETLLAFPNYIPFFNVAAGGSRGGLHILGDSNLDWGQDLKLLAQWQQRHPAVSLYFVYFGLADPGSYKIDYTNFPGGYEFWPDYKLTAAPGVLAISATKLQGIYNEPDLRDAYARLLELEPLEVLGGSIYLYRWPPPVLKSK